MHEQELRESIRSDICSGRLPSNSMQHILFGGKGEGVPCACCGRLITPVQVQYELDFGGACFEMHLKCHDEWMKASAELEAPTAAPSSAFARRRLTAR